jgi:NADH dehydrogenase
VVGAGFGGLATVRGLRGAAVDVLLVDQHNYHLFQPLLYQVASALLDPAEVAYPTRSILHHQANADFRLGRVINVDLASRRVETDRGPLSYDYLVLAAGSVDHFFGNASLEERTHGLKSLGAALDLRNHVLRCFEEAQWTGDPVTRRRLLSFAIVGAGPTGVEYAGALSELIRLALRRDFPQLDLGGVRVHLVEAAGDVLAPFAQSLRASARRRLASMGVEVHLNAPVREVREDGIVLGDGEWLEASTVVWCGGVRASEVGKLPGVQLGRSGRIVVKPTLQLPGHAEVFVIGDMAEVRAGKTTLPMLAPVAIQAGEHAARNVLALCRGELPQRFRYRDRGIMATIGRNAGVAQLGPLHLAGFAGWVTWIFVHLALLIGFRNRLVTLVNWGWEYVLRERPIRIIASREPAPAPPPQTGRSAPLSVGWRPGDASETSRPDRGPTR